MGQIFRWFPKFQTPGAKNGHRKLEFPEIAQNNVCGGSMVLFGSPVHHDQDTWFFEIGWKMVTAPYLGPKVGGGT